MTDTHTRAHAEPRTVQPTGLDPYWIDRDAYEAVERLQKKGHEAYLVGGCVRDLLLGRHPKDFDIATSARPQEVKRSFRNCRIIGRRFKLAHLHYQRNTKILEVSTFRRTPEEDGESDDLLITRDNEFGTAEEDAVRRDFTMNALFYDPVADRLIDFVGGLEHVHARKLETIGDPEVRFREDPVRILRAVKFAGRLGFTIEERTREAMAATVDDLSRSAPPRILEEILRLLRSGHAFASFRLLQELGALRVLLPMVAGFLDDASRDERTRFWRLLDALDADVERARGMVGPQPHVSAGPLPNGVLLGTLFVLPVLARIEAHPDRPPAAIAEDYLSGFTQDLRLPRRDAGCLKRICSLQPRFLGWNAKKRRSSRMSRLPDSPYFSEAVLLFELLASAAFPEHLAEVAEWKARACPVVSNGEFTRIDEREPALLFVDAPRRGGSWSRPTGDERADDAGRDERRGRRGKSSRGGGGGNDEDRRGRSGKSDERKSSQKRSDEDKRKKKKDKKRKKRDRDDRGGKHSDVQRVKARKETVEELEPEAFDVSMFDLELDAKRPPSFGTPLEGSTKKKKPRLPTSPEDDTYAPPPPPGSEAAPPPPPPPADDSDDEFGDW